MSGPKTSRYTLTPEQRQLLLRQRELEQRRAVLAERIKKTREQLRVLEERFRSEEQMAAELSARTGEDHGVGELAAELRRVTASALAIQADKKEIEAAERAAREIQNCLAQAEQLAQKITAAAVLNESALKENLQQDIALGFSVLWNEVQEQNEPSLRCRIAGELRQIRENQVLPEAYRQEAAAAWAQMEQIGEEEFLQNFAALSVAPLRKKADAFLAEHASCEKEFEALLTEYNALCSLYGEKNRQYPCSCAGVEALRQQIQRIKDAAAAEEEQAYISEALDAVMSEMGYEVLGSRHVTKRSGKKFRNELYSYGDGTAVNVTYSSDGKIAMELGGMDTTDRTPTAQEAESLCDSMAHFCEDFKEVEKRLLAKGVLPEKRISLLPPDAEYAQIINTSDYSISAEAGSVPEKKRRRPKPEKKSLRRG